MSPVSPVFHTEVRLSVGLKTCSEWNIHSIILDVHVGWQSAKNSHYMIVTLCIDSLVIRLRSNNLKLDNVNLKHLSCYCNCLFPRAVQHPKIVDSLRGIPENGIF